MMTVVGKSAACSGTSGDPGWILSDPLVEGWTVWQAGGSAAATPA